MLSVWHLHVPHQKLQILMGCVQFPIATVMWQKQPPLQSALTLRFAHLWTRLCPALSYSTSYEMVFFSGCALPIETSFNKQHLAPFESRCVCTYRSHKHRHLTSTIHKAETDTPKAEQCTIINIWGPCEHMNILKSNQEPQAWEFIDYNRPRKEGNSEKPNTVMAKASISLSSDYLMWVSREP